MSVIYYPQKTSFESQLLTTAHLPLGLCHLNRFFFFPHKTYKVLILYINFNPDAKLKSNDKFY